VVTKIRYYDHVGSNRLRSIKARIVISEHPTAAERIDFALELARLALGADDEIETKLLQEIRTGLYRFLHGGGDCGGIIPNVQEPAGVPWWG
jgi:hypothetical protein